ncbi:MAG: hypothetical protein JO271_19300 [Verrucomicrobia bacterium]|jgi:hypothetical protein|nr:hypothetical protein [Verrucomicrobiota bacterium]
MTTEKHEHALTEKALETLAKWGKDPNIDGGENIAFSLSRQGAPSDAFLGMGDCTPFTASGKRGILNGQPSGRTGAPIAYFDNFSGSSPAVNQVSFQFSFDLNNGRVSLSGSFPNLPANLHFTVEYLKEFEGNDGRNILFYSEKSSDNSGYIIAVQHVAAS